MTPDNPATLAQAFALMNEFVGDAYRVIQEETTAWGSSVSEALREYEKQVPKLRDQNERVNNTFQSDQPSVGV